MLAMGKGQDQWGMAITMENFVGSLYDIIYIHVLMGAIMLAELGCFP